MTTLMILLDTTYIWHMLIIFGLIHQLALIIISGTIAILLEFQSSHSIGISNHTVS